MAAQVFEQGLWRPHAALEARQGGVSGSSRRPTAPQDCGGWEMARLLGKAVSYKAKGKS